MDPVDRPATPGSVEEGNLVVATEHVGSVRTALHELGVYFAPVADSADLGLTLLDVPDEMAAAARVVSHLRQKVGQSDAEGRAANAAVQQIDAARATGLDAFLRGLRAVFAGRYQGWAPTLGKNRLLGNVEGGGGHISHAVADPARSDWRPGLRGTAPGRGVRVGVLDTSIGPQSWLTGGWVGPAADRLQLEPLYPALAGHGTFVTGLVLRQAPGCVVEFRRVLEDDGTASSWAVATKIVELGRAGVDVLNLSLGCFTADGEPPLVLATAIDRLDPDIVVVAAAGNHGDVDGTRIGPPPPEGTPPEDDPRPRLTAEDERRPNWPAALDDVIAVGAAEDDGALPGFTPRDVPWMDVVSSTYLEGAVDVPPPEGQQNARFDGVATWSGSSFAAALVSGAIAARTKPGSVSARRAWQQLLEERAIASATKVKPWAADPPPFVPLLDAPSGQVAE
jgi:membrane-anchored mycosin MYCP